MTEPLVTIAVPSYNQGRFLGEALDSIAAQNVAVEVYVADGGSTDSSLATIRQREPQLAAWRSYPDTGQSAAINEAIGSGSAPFVCWLNSDDFYYPGALAALVEALENSDAPAVYANCWHVSASSRKLLPYLTLPFREQLLANYCFIAQPATLIRREAWETAGGLDESLHMAMDYELWWKLYRRYGRFRYCQKFCAANRAHADTKTQNRPAQHYRESIAVVERYCGKAPLKWHLMQPLMRAVRRIQLGGR